MSEKQFFREIRCVGVTKGTACRKLLGLEYIYRGRIGIKCAKCGTLNEIEYKTPINTIERLEDEIND